ncbi:FliM/FliN family flagellar motor C-terminal domain-containing protein [Caballeronia telluris]|nr:FliM/FliN family flagellar motor C-terminal domain-containing protein [Caballeronia telluris]
MLIGQVIAPWLKDWFGARGAQALDVRAVRLISADAPYDFARAMRVSQSESSLWWALQRDAPRLLAALALDLPATSFPRAANEAVPAVRALGQRMVAELSRALASLCEGPAEAGPLTPSFKDTAPREGVLLSIAAPCGSELCAVVCPPSLLCERCAPRRDDHSRRRHSVDSRHDALSSTPVALHARLGQAQITLDQLLGLAPGDVITVNRKLHEPVDLLVSSSDRTAGRSIAPGRLGRTGTALSIQLDSNTAQENA